ncbi:MAG: DUF2341 domain-containing protein, partial [Verrucomicrobiota bacterium]
PETLANFPALIALGSNVNGFAYSQFAAADGGDLRFVSGDLSTELNFEVEAWNTNGLSWFWVQVPQLIDSNTCIFAVWGNPSATTPPGYTTNGAAWSQGYQAVWHMNESSVDELNTPGIHRDSSGNGHTGDQFGNAAGPGVIGQGQDFDGIDDYIDINTPISGNSMSISHWFNVNAVGGWHAFINHDGWAAGYLHYQFPPVANPPLRYTINGNFGDQNFPFAFNLGEWYHVTMAYDGTSGDLISYVNGTEIGRSVGLGTGNNVSPTPGNIGAWNGNDRRFNGQMDEFRITDSVLSSNWVWATWFNTVSNEAFVCYDAPIPLDLALTKTVDATNLLAGVSNLTYTIDVMNLSTSVVGGIIVTDSLPRDVILVSSLPAVSQTNGNNYSFDIGLLAGGGSTSITINAAVTSSVLQTLTNWAVVTTTNIDARPANNIDSAITVIVPPAAGNRDLALTKTASSTNLLLDTNLTWTLTVTNLSSGAAAGVTVTDTVPAGVIILSASPPATQTNGNDYVFSLGSLNGGAETSIVIQAAVTTAVPGIITNRAWTATADPETNLANNIGSAPTTIPDSDGDGIANPADPDDDNDGVSDEDETIAGTDPLDPNSFLWIRIMKTGVVNIQHLTFPTSTGRMYRIQRSTRTVRGSPRIMWCSDRTWPVLLTPLMGCIRTTL